MTPTETAAALRQYNVWRRGNLEDLPQPDPREIGETIDAAIEMIERMEKQVPVGWFARVDGDGPLMECKHAGISRVLLYAIPGAQPALVGARKVTRDFRWDSATQCHVPTLKIEFEPVPAGAPSDAKGWQDQDRIAALLEAAPGAQEAKP